MRILDDRRRDRVAATKDQNALAHEDRLLEGVRDDDTGQALLLAELHGQLLKRLARADVEGRKGLVHEQPPRRGDQGPRDGAALPFATGDLMRIALGQGRDAESLQPVLGARRDGRGVEGRIGLTPAPPGALQALHAQYATQGLTVLGFPCNQFGRQEKGSADEIATFCKRNFGVQFPLMDKIEVNGDGAHPLYRWLTAQAPGLLGSKAIKWNFTKFLVGRDGQVMRRYAPQDAPAKLSKDIEAALATTQAA